MSVRKIRILTSCTGQKLYKPENQLTTGDFRLQDLSLFQERESQLENYRLPAEAMYTGQQHIRLMRGIEAIRQDPTYDIDLQIVSAGYGIIAGDQTVVPYECTFQTMKSDEIDQWSIQLGIPQAARTLFEQPADLMLVALGNQYLRALQLDNSVRFGAPTVFFVGESAAHQVPNVENVFIRTLRVEDAKRFRCGLVSLKGELVARFLKRFPGNADAISDALLSSDDDAWRELVDEPVPVKTQLVAVPRLELVDHVIKLPRGWRKSVDSKAIRYFIPDWEDLVDPEYDFESDSHSGGKGTWANQVYAHQMFVNDGISRPNYDGILVSRAVIERSGSKFPLIKSRGIHRHLRVPSDFPVMGDCGAFSYVLQETPPYSTEDVLNYYTELGFDYGVSVDHLLFGAADDAGKQWRYQLTIQNAEDFIREHRASELAWTPIGALQGQTPQEYAQAAAKYVKMGYTYLAIGGQVRSRTPDILRIAEAIRGAIPPQVKLHLLGVARLESLNDFIRLGINSVDSASYLRQAWIRLGQNYIGHDGLYAAIRIPEVERHIRKGVAPDQAELLRILERDALAAMRGLDREEVDPDTAMDVVMRYKDALGIKLPNRVIGEYRATLKYRPWRHCDCPICRDAGVEVLIFRGNNRNRRRGFHNNYAFYRLMARTLKEGQFDYPWRSVLISDQPLLF